MAASKITDNKLIADTMTLGGIEVPVETGNVRQIELSFFPENPRLYSIVHTSDGEPTQEQIEEQLKEREHVRALAQSIKANGGLTDPIIVRKGDFVVLEGNSRLAAVRILAKFDPIKWGVIKAVLLPEDISDALVFTLLGQYHIVGKTAWAPFEQAGYFYRRNLNDNVEPKELAKQVGVSTRKVTHFIGVYKFMVDHDDTNVSHWSYYDQYLSKRVINDARAKHAELDDVVVSKIKSGEISRAVDIRNNLSRIVESPRALSVFCSDANTFEEAIDRTSDQTDWFRRFKRFRDQIIQTEALVELQNATEQQRKKCTYELKKIIQRIEKMLNSV